MLQVKHLTVTHLKDSRVLLNDFSFTLNRGDKAVVVGEEGDGKSTLLKLIFDDRLVADYVEYTGEIIKNGLRLGYLAQELPEAKKSRSIFSYCSGIRPFADLTPGELSDIASQLGLRPELFYSDRKVASLSGGEKVKLQLAGILMARPDILLLDEPSNDLDLEALAWLENFINCCGLPVIFVSHDETLIEKTANVVIHLEQLRRKALPRCTVARMPYRKYMEERTAAFSQQRRLAGEEENRYRKQQEKFRRIREKVEYQQNTISRSDPHGGRLLKKKMKAVQSMGKRLDREHEADVQLPESEDSIMLRFGGDITVPNGKTVLDFSLDSLCAGGRVLCRNIRLRVTGPQKICMVGRNGVGKTTLLKAIADVLLPRRDLKAAYMPQDYEELLRSAETPVDFLERTGRKEEITRIRTFLGSVKYTPNEMGHRITEMSGGQKAKLLFLKMILDGCNVLLLDEPTRNFSPLSSPVIRGILKSFGGTIISVSHDRKYISEVCGTVYRLTEDGLQLQR